MTHYIGLATGLVNGGISPLDERLTAQAYRGGCERHQPEWHDRGFRSEFWPRSGFEGDSTADGFIEAAKWYEQPELSSGSISRVGYRGVTRDVNNTPVAGVTVKIFRTADDLKQADDVVSDVDGNFVITTPYYEPHYLVMKKTASPDIGGVTISTQYPNT